MRGCGSRETASRLLVQRCSRTYHYSGVSQKKGMEAFTLPYASHHSTEALAKSQFPFVEILKISLLFCKNNNYITLIAASDIHSFHIHFDGGDSRALLL